jgi:hypothetical protein
MKHKDDVIHIRVDGRLLANLNELARRQGDNNTSMAARCAMRAGLRSLGIDIDVPTLPYEPESEPTPEDNDVMGQDR